MAAGAAVIQNDPSAENSASSVWSLPVYVRGALATRTVIFSVGGTPTNTTVAATLRRPDGVSTALTPTNGAAGTYTVLVDTSPVRGEWTIHWVGSGAVQAAVDDVFFVESV